jgi:hypothetical protein
MRLADCSSSSHTGGKGDHATLEEAVAVSTGRIGSRTRTRHRVELGHWEACCRVSRPARVTHTLRSKTVTRRHEGCEAVARVPERAAERDRRQTKLSRLGTAGTICGGRHPHHSG